MEYVRSVSYSILINGKPTEPFEAKKRLRHGDPLSPFLFVLGMEYLSRLLKGLTTTRDFRFHPKCAKLQIIQLGFTDDLLLFSRGDQPSIQLLLTYFQKFSQASCSVANMHEQEFCIFLLPKNILLLIERICRTFLWTCGVEVTKKALIAWEKLCIPKAAGGLYLLNISKWNRAALCKMLWNLCKKKDKLWFGGYMSTIGMGNQS
ncbi:uncharacterized protein LOC142173623 [Nicotiana tabacum]|uniref:Uncharacterized protein LOC142173623 n=1 Tax=Nicotiana tabacum TaxID=4097 RepID=A0AC58TDP9_TOBAC